MNLVFDWAGTLANDQELTWRLTNETIRNFGHAPVDYEDYTREFKSPAEGFYRTYCPGVGMDAIEEFFVDVSRRRYPNAAELWPGVGEGLACLACRHQLFILSTLDQDVLETTLERLGLRRHFRAVRGSTPDKRVGLPELLLEFRLAPDETVMIGDTLHDLDAARAAHVAPFAVAYGYAGREVLETGFPEMVFATFAELLRQLDKLSCAESRHFPVATVGALVFDSDGKMLLVRTRKWSGLYGIPGGKVDYGETLEAACARELREETGLEIRDIRFVMVQDCVEHPEFYRPRHFILANYTAKVAGVSPAVRLNHESDHFIWSTPTEVWDLALNGPTRTLLRKVLGKETA